MTQQLTVKNVKCSGCATRIEQGLSDLAGIDSVRVDVATGQVTLTGESFSKDEVLKVLDSLGYPVV